MCIMDCVDLVMFVLLSIFCVFFFKQKTAYEWRISDWSSDVCSSDLAWLGVVACAAVAWCKPAWQSWRRPLLYLALAVLLSTSVVAWMKSWTHVDCPWDLVGFGGTRSYHDLLAALPAHVPHGHCFPAGHASAGYAGVALFFFFGRTPPTWRWKGLAA